MKKNVNIEETTKHNKPSMKEIEEMKLTKEEKEEVKKQMGDLAEIISKIDKINNKLADQFPVSEGEIRDLVKIYYQLQGSRIAVGNQAYAEVKLGVKRGYKAHPIILLFIQRELKKLEEQIVPFMEQYAKSNIMGQWLLSIKGIGPVFAAGLLAYIDIERCETAGSIWSYAGLTGNPEHDTRVKGKKLEYDPGFKTLCWKIGESFIKNANRSYYGGIYAEKRAIYDARNEAGEYAERAAEILKKKKYDEKTVAYKAYSSGKFPTTHITGMARRFAVKIFLSHLFEIWYEYDRGCKPPKPFVEAHLGHVHISHAPNREIVFPNEI